MVISFYKFSKKNNSTKIVDVQGTNFNSCQLKDHTNMITPTILVNAIPQSWATIWNYCYIPMFTRYYFINDWTWVNGVWECSCTVDVLASWKTEIGASEMYILRTNSTDGAVYNAGIMDTIYPTTSQFTKFEIEAQSPFVTALTSGLYVVGVINKGDPSEPTKSVGAITYYAMTAYWLELLKRELLTDDNLKTMSIIDNLGNMLVNDVSKEVLKTMYNPYQYIVSCMWFPINQASLTGYNYVTSINLGWWTYNVPAYQLSAQVLSAGFVESFDPPFHPQAANRGYYLNYEPYTKTTLLGRFGTIPLNMHYFDLDDDIYLYYEVDLIEGLTLLKICARKEISGVVTERLIMTRTFQLGVPIQLAQVGVDYMGQAMANVNAVGGIVGGAFSGASSGGAVGGAAGAVLGGVGGVVNGMLNATYSTTAASMPQMETSGANGSFILPLQTTKFLQLYYWLAPEDIEHKGRPVYYKHVINTLSGFVLCADGDFDIPCMENERQMISAYLTNGFFWE